MLDVSHRMNVDISMNSDPIYPSLQFLGQESEIEVGRNRLPHWQAGQVACFITFRLADSLPRNVLVDWRHERDAWLIAHPQPWDSATEMEYHRKFSTFIDRELDSCHGDCLLGVPEYAAVLAETLSARDGTDYQLHSWVIMPNHVHILMSPMEVRSISNVVCGWKRFSATRIGKISGTGSGLWQKDYFDRLIRDWDHFQNVARYIRRNPSKACLNKGRFLLFEAPWVSRVLG